MRSINLSMEGFKIPLLIYIHVMSDVLPLEGVPIGVTRVAKICALKKNLYFLHV
jgi:hypothetical protein